MGICGSCGMNVDGEPKLTCATFLSDYAPGPVTVEPLVELPRDPRPRRRPDRLHGRSCRGSSRGSSARRTTAGRARRGVPPDARGSWTPTSSSACASTACSATPPARSTGSTPSSSARPRSRSPSATTSTRATRERAASRRAHRARRRLGLHVRRRVHAGVPQARGSRVGHPALQAEGGACRR